MAYDVSKQVTLGQLKKLATATSEEIDERLAVAPDNIATDDEVSEMLAEVFGTAGTPTTPTE